MYNPNLFQYESVVVNNGSGAGTSKSAPCNGHKKLLIEATGSATATFTVEATAQEVGSDRNPIPDDVATWVPLQLTNVSTGAAATSIADKNLYSADVSGLIRARANISSFTAGATDPKGITVTFTFTD